jgi:DNA-binding winged helix-turn-helix (wHTH) protein
MVLQKRNFRSFLIVFSGIVSILALQAVWLNDAYRLTSQQLMVSLQDAFEQAYEKEQAYRVPIIDIVNPGDVTIKSCGAEEVHVIRKCPDPDTIVYNNLSGHSIENFINHVFTDLREHITPMNINCLSDLFAGLLHDKDIPLYFVIERFNIASGKVMESSLLPDKKQPEADAETTIVLNISEKESIRAVLQLTPGIVFGRMYGCLAGAICLTVVAIFCLCFLYRYKAEKQNPDFAGGSEVLSNPVHDNNNNANQTFAIGQYSFDPDKNELQGYGESVQLNKKENAILYALCMQCGNVVERSILLEKNWGNNGIIYSRSLDTYVTTLRKYFKKDPSIQIVTIKGVGYKLVLTK